MNTQIQLESLPLRVSPPFRAEHVGSFLRPRALLEARDRVTRGELDVDELQRFENDAIRMIVKFQEQVGFRSVTDGEFRRCHYHTDFLSQLDGVVQQNGSAERYRSARGELQIESPTLAVVGQIRHLHPVHVNDFQYLRSVTRALPKLTMPAPTMLYRGRASLSQVVYPDVEQFCADVAAAYQAELKLLAEAGCTYVQLDDTNLACLCDPEQREALRQRGEDPQRLQRLYVDLINAAVANVPPEMTVCLHLCRGNFRSGWAASGGYEPIAEMLFNELDVAGFFLEYDDARSGDFRPLRHLPPEKIAVLGLVTTKLGALEKKDDIRRRIDEAARFAPLGQLCLSPQCGFSSAADGNDIRVRQQEAKCRLIAEVAREVWGDV